MDIQSRTQNGHIRNDTRVVSRRIFTACNRPICRRKCVASDRACTRVTLPNLHGKEGVDGSSPSEGSAKAPQKGAFCFSKSCRISNMWWVWSPLWSFQIPKSSGNWRRWRRCLTCHRSVISSFAADAGLPASAGGSKRTLSLGLHLACICRSHQAHSEEGKPREQRQARGAD